MHLSKRVLVTGGSGFIGSYLCERLLDFVGVIDPLRKRLVLTHSPHGHARGKGDSHKAGPYGGEHQPVKQSIVDIHTRTSTGRVNASV